MPHFASTIPKQLMTAVVPLLLLLCATSIWAQATDPTPTADPTTTPTPESEELRRLRERNAILEEEKKAAEYEKAIAEAKKNELDAKFPKPSTSPLEGKTEIDSGVKLESEMVAYMTISRAANLMASEMKKKVNAITALAIHNDRDVKSLLGYMVSLNQMKLLEEEYNKLLRTRPLSDSSGSMLKSQNIVGAVKAISVARSLLGSFVDLIALFRTDTNIKGMDFNVEESVLVSEIFRALKDSDIGYGENVRLFYPAVFPPHIKVNNKFKILGQLHELNNLKVKAEESISRIEEGVKAINKIKGEITALEKRLEQIGEEITKFDKELERLQRLSVRWPSARNAERTEEATALIVELKTERDNLPGKIKDKKESLKKLERELDEFYGEVLPAITQESLIVALIETLRKIASAEEILGREFTPVERKAFAKGLSPIQKEALLREAESHASGQGKPLTAEDKKSLLDEVSRDAWAAIKKIEDKGGEGGVAPEELLSVLSVEEQFGLLSLIEKAAQRKLKEQALTRLKALNAQYEKLIADLVKVEGNVGINALTAYLQAENLRDALGCTEENDTCSAGYLLQVKVVRAGGNNKIKKNLITNAFTGANISHSGGSIVEYILYDMTGDAKSSNTFTVYEDYKKAKDIKKTLEDKDANK